MLTLKIHYTSVYSFKLNLQKHSVPPFIFSKILQLRSYRFFRFCVPIITHIPSRAPGWVSLLGDLFDRKVTFFKIPGVHIFFAYVSQTCSCQVCPELCIFERCHERGLIKRPGEAPLPFLTGKPLVPSCKSHISSDVWCRPMKRDRGADEDLICKAPP